MIEAAGLEILLLCGSYHPGSANRAVLEAAREALESMAGISVQDSIGLDNLPALSADSLEAPPPPVEQLRDEVRRADAVIIAGPEYAGGVAGSLKNALDWCVGAIEGFYGKPVALFSAGTTGGPNAIHQLARTLLWQGAHLAGSLGIAGPRAKCDPSTRLVDVSTLEGIREVCTDLVSMISMEPAERVRWSHGVALELDIGEYPHAPTDQADRLGS